jgi:GAF domain-containing protein
VCHHRLVDATDHDSLEGHLAQAARDLQAERGTQHTIDRSVLIATQLIAGCDFAGVSVIHPSLGPDSPAVTDGIVAEVNQLQYELNEGPCLDIISTEHTVYASNLSEEQRWPRWSPRVARLGVASILCVRLYTSQETVGALTVLSRRANAFPDNDITIATHLAAHLAVALAESQNADALHSASLDRIVIARAEGILMERFSLAADQAFAVLGQVSQDLDSTVQHTAAELLRNRQTPGGQTTATNLTHPPQPWLL